MNTRILKKYLWLLLIGLLPLGLVACSDSDDPVKEIEKPNGSENEEEKVVAYQDARAYANFFAYNVMNDVYLWKQDITSALESWKILTDPIQAVETAR